MVKERRKMEHVLFDGTLNRFFTTVSIFAITFTCAIVADLESIQELTMLGISLTCFLVFMQFLLYSTFMIGPFSLAYGDWRIVDVLVASFQRGNLDDNKLEAGLRCIYNQVEKGNTMSKRILEKFVTRSDELGLRASHLVQGFNK